MHENSHPMTIETIEVKTTARPGKNRRIVARAREHEIVMDMKKEMMGDDTGPTPPELMAMALAGCMVNIARIMAEQKGTKLNDLQVVVSGPIDPSKAMGMQSPNPTGFKGLTVEVAFGTDLSQADQKAFKKELMERCALCDTIANSTPMDIHFCLHCA